MPRVTITIPEKNPQPYRFPLDTQLVTLGRGSENDIVIDCGSVSVRHAVMERLAKGYVLRDLGSTNGTKLDGERRERIELRHGMTAQLGDVEFDFQLSEEERAQMQREEVEGKGPSQDDGAPPSLPPLSSGKIAEDEKKSHQDQDKEEAHHKSGSSSSKSSLFSLFVLFVLSVGIAFFIGLSVRHHKETGSWFFRETAPVVSASIPSAPHEDMMKSPPAPPAATEPAKPAATEPAPPAATEPAPPAATEPAPPAATEPAPPAATEPAPPAATEPAPPTATEPAPPATTEPAPQAPNA